MSIEEFLALRAPQYLNVTDEDIAMEQITHQLGRPISRPVVPVNLSL